MYTYYEASEIGSFPDSAGRAVPGRAVLHFLSQKRLELRIEGAMVSTNVQKLEGRLPRLYHQINNNFR
jgi:hypothetical protein